MQRKQLLGIARRAERTVGVHQERWMSTASRIVFTAMGLAAAAYAATAALTWARYGSPSTPADDGADPLLDEFMPAYEVVERHQVRVAAPAQTTLEAASEQDLLRSPVVRAVIKTRELVLGGEPDDRLGAKGLLATVRSLGWGVLREIPGREIVVGAVTKPWEADVVFRAVPPEDFAAFDEPDYVKIAWTLRADAIGPNESIFRTETRAIATDAGARAKFRRYWAFVSPGVALIRRMSLNPLKADAERRARAPRVAVRAASISAVQ
jgi:hypothetical protein